MIKKPHNWNEVQEFADRQKLPLGAYVCKVKKSLVQDNNYGSQLVLLFDISEGEHTGFYNKDFQNNQNADKKWKGVLRVWIPTDDGSDKDEITKRTFKGMVTAFEKSNPGYRFDWNEASLVGKTVGILHRNEEWDYNGKHGWAVRPFRAISADSVREESYNLPKDKPLANKPIGNTYTADNGFTEVDDEELPWN